MTVKRKYFDLAIGESNGNGGDIQYVGNDIAVINGKENQVYLALFGGNVEGDTTSVNSNSGWWGNNLFHKGRDDRQFNSKTERTLNTTALNSAGRAKIENAIKDDLKFLQDRGADVTVEVTIPSVNTVKMIIRVKYPGGPGRVTIISFGKNSNVDGDFFILDFNEDFF